MNPQTQFQPGTGVEPTSTIEISISCKNLLDKDVFSRSDPMVVVYKLGVGNQREEILRTEVISDSTDPQFTEKVVTDYRFEEEQRLRFEVYDIDTSSKNLADHDFLGFCESTIANIVSSGYKGLTIPLMDKQPTNRNSTKPSVSASAPRSQLNSNGTMTLVAEELLQLKEEVTLQLSGHSMGSGFLGCFPGKLFFTLSKTNEGGSYIIVYKSDVAPGPSPLWNPVSLTTGKLCNGDRDRSLKICIFKEGLNGYHVLLGSTSASLNRIIGLSTTDVLPLTNESGAAISGNLKVAQCKLTPIYTFLDYIQGGTSIHCSFAIDLTGSNGDPKDPSSLHFVSPDLNFPNPYQQAIQSVGSIVSPYSRSQIFPCMGFGARLPPSGNISHNFNLNLDNPNQCPLGIPQVLDTYRNAITRVQLWGPTNFSPIIRQVSDMAFQNSGGNNYYILLIITDGIISDMNETKDAIVKASTLPLSIIIVGVGNANFDAMEVLDGDTVRLSSNGRVAARDIVQFVAYRDAYSWLQSMGLQASNRQTAGIYGQAQARLAREVLAEVPQQLTSYMKSRSLKPNNPQNPVGFVGGVLPQQT